MTILITGSTGTIGSKVVRHLAGQGAQVHALVRDVKKAAFPPGVQVVQGDLTEVDSIRAALQNIDTLFLLNAVVPDELTQALVTLDLAREAGIQRLVYFSVFYSALFADVPHFTGKRAVERAIDDQGIAATVLRPGYFFQNDARLKEAILGNGVYPVPIGDIGLAMVDARDIAEIAANELLRRERASGPLPANIIDVVGPNVLTGAAVARIWADTLGREVRYAGDDLDAFEAAIKKFAPGWMARDMRIMMRAFQQHGMRPAENTMSILETLLNRPMRSYANFARETADEWRRAG
jgi:uncharacterized protein YbjT (DUF2867 family)